MHYLLLGLMGLLCVSYMVKLHSFVKITSIDVLGDITGELHEVGDRPFRILYKKIDKTFQFRSIHLEDLDPEQICIMS